MCKRNVRHMSFIAESNCSLLLYYCRLVIIIIIIIIIIREFIRRRNMAKGTTRASI